MSQFALFYSILVTFRFLSCIQLYSYYREGQKRPVALPGQTWSFIRTKFNTCIYNLYLVHIDNQWTLSNIFLKILSHTFFAWVLKCREPYLSQVLDSQLHSYLEKLPIKMVSVLIKYTWSHCSNSKSHIICSLFPVGC
jgi:hypothetical protein